MPLKKSYCFTLNNYDESEYESLVRSLEDQSDYAVVGREVGESGTRHLQGYVRFKKPYRFSTIKDRFLPRAHIELARGDAQQNRRYCIKDGNFVEFGTIGDSGGRRSQLAGQFVAAMESRRSGLVAFAHEQPGTWYYSGSQLLRNWLTLQPPIERPTVEVQWFYGSAGTGKSRRAHEDYPEAYIKEPKSKWWNGYLLEDSVIIDDYGPQCIDINHLLRWFDRYKCLVENKHGMLPLYATKFVVTSNFHPTQLFKSSVFSLEGSTSSCNQEDHPQLPALLRRIKLIEFN